CSAGLDFEKITRSLRRNRFRARPDGLYGSGSISAASKYRRRGLLSYDAIESDHTS
uniref:Uncharacterized protein n=1 Tax=Globisporangium ultimum (strain ATCC 200006 / CBS 805.95 / DAOM BR144) TaxID=431595 RepID=K3X4N6_GLOUD